jgi:Domain of unknown function (DUF6899)
VPYIPPEDRAPLDPLIDDLAARIAARAGESGSEIAVAGLLNYACTRLGLAILKLRFGRVRYGLIALLTGTFQNVADELYRRLAAPYEQIQIERNGDVDLFEELLAGMPKA